MSLGNSESHKIIQNDHGNHRVRARVRVSVRVKVRVRVRIRIRVGNRVRIMVKVGKIGLELGLRCLSYNGQSNSSTNGIRMSGMTVTSIFFRRKCRHNVWAHNLWGHGFLTLFSWMCSRSTPKFPFFATFLRRVTE